METTERLVLDLLEWIGQDPRPYAEAQEVWRTSCPRLSVWEDAMASGYLERRVEPVTGLLVAVSPRGAAHLRAHLDRGE
jgi:D-3-phosphoglycerate dehydrogenase / 2-oxoglutarate reductase